MDVLGQTYELKGMVHCVSHHFTIAIKTDTEWIYIDDMCVSVRSFTSIQDLLNSYPNGWFFATFEKSSCTVIGNDIQANFMPCQTSFLHHSFVESGTQSREPEMVFKSDKCNFFPCQTDKRNKQDDMCNEKKRRRSE